MGSVILVTVLGMVIIPFNPDGVGTTIIPFFPVSSPGVSAYQAPSPLTTVLSGLHFSDGEAEATGVSCLTCPLTTDQSSGDQSAPPRTQLNPEPAD